MTASAKGIFTIYRHGAPHTPKNALRQVEWTICCDGVRVTLADRVRQMVAYLQEDHAQVGDLVFTGYKKGEVQVG